ncbi:MAG: outer membrane protein assembly factor BamD, partial [Treponema sp.]|nr:outer membrane protein assembly factor BamD [Treponema sp.]
SEAVEQNTQPKLDTKPVEIIPSRKVTVNTNETLSITYPGYGWIYLGSESENNNLVSTGRKVENEETVYTLTAKNPGTQLQHFYKVDTITGSFIDDYIEVEVLDNKGSVYTIVKAPDYGQVVPERPVVPAVASTNRPLTQDEILEKAITPTEKRNFIEYTPEPEPAKKVVEEKSIYSKTPDSYIENLDADDLLAKAKELFSQEKFVESQKYLNNFMEIATEKRDEGLFLQGQIFEQDGATKNIKESISSYTTLTESYPESIYWDDAKKRIIYLNRFYIQIR